MRKLIALALVVALAAPAMPATPAEASLVTGSEAYYVGGTITGLKAGTLGQLDMTRADALTFTVGADSYSIPYKGVQSFEYSRKLARRIGVIATIAVVAIAKRRQRKHFFTISYKDEEGVTQVAMLEVPKQQAPILMTVLRERSVLATSTQSRQRLIRR